MKDGRLRVLALASHPVQYSAPVFRLMAQHPRLDFQVAYCSLRGAEAAHDPEFGTTVQWDVPLLEGYPWTHIPNRFLGGDSSFNLCNPGLWPLILKGKFDAILCYATYQSFSFWIAYLAAKWSGAVFLFGTDSTTLTPVDDKMWKRRLKRMAWPRLFQLADQVIVPSSGTRDLILSLGVPNERVTLTPYTVDNDWWRQGAGEVDRDAVRARWGAKPETFVILFCAKLQPRKRPHDLLLAFAKAGASQARLIFAGEGPLRPALEVEAESLGIGDRVRFLGFVNQSQLPATYRAADLLVLPSSYEPFGVVVNEAICCGCPVIASDRVGAAADLIAPVQPEFVFRCGDIDGLAALLSRAARDRTTLAEVASRASDHLRSWSPERNVTMTIEAIEKGMSRVSRGTIQAHRAPVQTTKPSVPGARRP